MSRKIPPQNFSQGNRQQYKLSQILNRLYSLFSEGSGLLESKQTITYAYLIFEILSKICGTYNDLGRDPLEIQSEMTRANCLYIAHKYYVILKAKLKNLMFIWEIDSFSKEVTLKWNNLLLWQEIYPKSSHCGQNIFYKSRPRLIRSRLMYKKSRKFSP